jgi:O-antigen biosynthesis alpha-1,3-abequosyltransferase
VKLSFCIPTYNHGQFIGCALDSIIAEAPKDAEIIVVDGGSVDNTQAVVEGYLLRYSNIKYRRFDKNRGIDLDIAEAVSMADGDYCWLMSSDDAITPGAVGQVMRVLSTGRTLYLVGRIVCTEELVPFETTPVFRDWRSRSWDFAFEQQLLDYLQSARGLVALFSYLSVLIFRRKAWCSAQSPSDLFGSCYAHSYRLWQMLANGGQVEFIGGRPLVMCRMGTDNFSGRGFFRRYLLDFDGYLRISREILSTQPSARVAFLAVIRREHNFFRLLKFYGACSSAEEREVAIQRLRAIGHTGGYVRGIRAAAQFRPLVRLAAVIWREWRRFFGTVRQNRTLTRGR